MANATMPTLDPMVPILQSASAMLIMGLCMLIACHCLIAVYVAYSHAFPPPTPTIRVEFVCPQNQPVEPASETEEELCYACADSKPDTMLLACGHQGLCTSCAKHLWKLDRRCPLCRTALKGMVFLD
jgi:hypothetical protein